MKHFYRWMFMGTTIIALLAAWFFWTPLRDALVVLQRPTLPVAKTFVVPASTATSTDPLALESALPRSLNLAVPFVLQAPRQNWALPYQEACEEAAAIMVDGYYRGQKSFTIDEQDRAILSVVDFEKKTLGFYEDTTAEQTAQFIRGKFGWKNVIVRDVNGVDDIKRALANGYPVIIPASGVALKNPNFRNGGPPYHMIVVKGYLPDGRWITNDAGTRNGADYVYTNEVLMNAAHDWNGGDVLHGKRVMIVVVAE